MVTKVRAKFPGLLQMKAVWLLPDEIPVLLIVDRVSFQGGVLQVVGHNSTFIHVVILSVCTFSPCSNLFTYIQFISFLYRLFEAYVENRRIE